MILQRLLTQQYKSQRSFFYWLTIVFNRVDKSRIKAVGPDVACAEWLLRNGASVRWQNSKSFLSDYNTLVSQQTRYCIEAVDATDSSIHHIGFPYFSGCKFIQEIKLANCLYIEDEALERLSMLRDTLKDLEIDKCKAVTDEGLYSLKALTNLKTLKLRNLIYVKEKAKVEEELRKALPNCNIDYQ